MREENKEKVVYKTENLKMIFFKVSKVAGHLFHGLTFNTKLEEYDFLNSQRPDVDEPVIGDIQHTPN